MVSLKYVLLLMRADNQGEGGILALLALLIGDLSRSSMKGRQGLLWVSLALAGTALLYGDGVITPAISVLSAVEGLSVATPAFDPYIVPLTVINLLGLFSAQSKGSGKVGVAFGPILVTWFVVILVLGLASLVQTPRALAAFNPMAAFSFFQQNGFRGFVALGAVVLCLTGGEALYADMGHFGRRPIRLAWYGLALPALAAKALITAVFSLTSQAMQLGLSPRFRVINTSAATRGQIYLPALNWLLMGATIAVVRGFRSSASLAAAFGLAVSATMAITTVLFSALARQRWGWGVPRIVALAGVFLLADLAFFGANALKFTEGGWLPVLLGAAPFLVMFAWRYGRLQLAAARRGSGMAPQALISALRRVPPHRVEGTAVFMCERSQEAPTALMHHLKHNQVLHERVILLTLETVDVPRVSADKRLKCEDLGLGFLRIVAQFGFMESPNVPAVLEEASQVCGEVRCRLELRHRRAAVLLYLGDYPANYTRPYTTEVYAGRGYGPVTLKYSYAPTNLFGCR